MTGFVVQGHICTLKTKAELACSACITLMINVVFKTVHVAYPQSGLKVSLVFGFFRAKSRNS